MSYAFVHYFGPELKKGGVKLMIEEHDDLMVLEEGQSTEAVQACCVTNSAKLR